jgi:hypothetical protein
MPSITMTVFRAPSGRLHLRPSCSGGAAVKRMSKLQITEAEFAAADRCRCLTKFRPTPKGNPQS